MNKSIPYADTILGFLMSKDWIIEDVEVIDGESLNYLLKPPVELNIEDKAFRYKIPVKPDKEDLPVYWNYLSVMIDGISTIYQLTKSDIAIFYKPLSQTFKDYAFYLSQKDKRENITKEEELPVAA